MSVPKQNLDWLVRDGKVPPYSVSKISKDEAKKAIEVEGIDVADQLATIESSETIYRLQEAGGWQTTVIYNESGTVMLLTMIKPR